MAFRNAKALLKKEKSTQERLSPQQIQAVRSHEVDFNGVLLTTSFRNVKDKPSAPPDKAITALSNSPCIFCSSSRSVARY